MTRGLYFVLIFLLVCTAYAQQSCSQLLNRAEDLYNDGRLLEIPGLIAGCLEEEINFTEAEKIRARKLLTKVYIFTDNEAAAETQLVELLTVDPVHELQREDPSELRVLMAKFRTWPIYRLEGKFGINMANTSIEQEFFAFSSDEGHKDYDNTIGLGWQLEANITRHWKKGVEGGAGVQFRSSKYTVLSRPTNHSEELFTTNIENSQTMFRFPLFVRYNLNYDAKKKRLLPYVLLGGSFDYLFKANYSNASRNGGTSFTIDKGRDANLLKANQVNKTNWSAFASIGAKIPMNKGNFGFVEIRHDRSLNLYNIPEERYSNEIIYSDLQYVEDDLFLNFTSINFGFIYSVFKPTKLFK
ncbi:MAG: PorT family protein [Cytophagales bacterium]|nr:PorT family protein [Cytophagales bacterium]